jgi:hypothetical protein
MGMRPTVEVLAGTNGEKVREDLRWSRRKETRTVAGRMETGEAISQGSSGPKAQSGPVLFRTPSGTRATPRFRLNGSALFLLCFPGAVTSAGRQRSRESKSGLTRAKNSRRRYGGSYIDETSRRPRIWPDHKTKFTVRMYRGDIERVITRARALGAPYGTYISALIDGAPPPLIIDPQHAIAALASSTDRLTAIAADLDELMGSIRRGAILSVEDCGRPVEELTRLIQPHLEAASRLMTELMPARPRRPSRRRRTQRIKSWAPRSTSMGSWSSGAIVSSIHPTGSFARWRRRV